MNEKTRQLMREARESKNMKQSDVAEKLGVTLQAVSSWERGKNDIDMDSFVAYCQVCEADFTEILKQAYGDPAQMQNFQCTSDEAEIIRRYRLIDERGKKTSAEFWTRSMVTRWRLFKKTCRLRLEPGEELGENREMSLPFG